MLSPYIFTKTNLVNSETLKIKSFEGRNASRAHQRIVFFLETGFRLTTFNIDGHFSPVINRNLFSVPAPFTTIIIN